MPLYDVEVVATTSMVVYANRQDQAEEVAKKYWPQCGGEESTVRYTLNREIRSTADLPDEWTTDCIPWGETHNTVGDFVNGIFGLTAAQKLLLSSIHMRLGKLGVVYMSKQECDVITRSNIPLTM